MKNKQKNSKRKQSNLSRVLASSNRTVIVQKNFFELTANEIRRSIPELARHRHFKSALHPNGQGPSGIYNIYTAYQPIDKCLAWCLGLLEIHAEQIRCYLNIHNKLLRKILLQEYESALSDVQEFNQQFGISSWCVSLQGALRSSTSPESKRNYLEGVISDANDNMFFKALAANLANRFDNPETLHSENIFFELKLKRSFSGNLLNFLLYKLVPYNYESDYDFEGILDLEKNSSPVDIFICLVDFLSYNIHSEDEALLNTCRSVLNDLRRNFNHEMLFNFAVAYGLAEPVKIENSTIQIIDKYTSGFYKDLCVTMKEDSNLIENFSIVEILAKALSRIEKTDEVILPQIIPFLVDVINKTSNFAKARAELLAYCHAFGMFVWFKELRHFLERETSFYDARINKKIHQSSLLLTSVSTPAKVQELVRRGIISDSDIDKLIPNNSVTARLFRIMRSNFNNEPSVDELHGIEENRRSKFTASWFLSRGRYQEAIPILQYLRLSYDIRTAQDASRSLVEAYRSTGEIEKAAEVYIEALLANINLLSAFDSAGLSETCSSVIKHSHSISIPIVLSIYSRFVGDAYDAALKYSFECFLHNNNYKNPLDLLSDELLKSKEILYFLRYICTPEVMKLYLYFSNSKDIEQCRIDICKVLITLHDNDEELLFEIKERTRKLVLREAVSQVQGGRIYSDVNFLNGNSSGAFKTLFEKYSVLRIQDFTMYEDEVSLQEFFNLMKKDKLIFENAHTIHIQNLVLNEKNSIFLKLIKLARDEFAFGEKGLNLYLSTRIRHGHFPTALRKPLLDNMLLASKATDTSGYKLGKDWKKSLHPGLSAEAALESAIIEFSVKFNDLVDHVNDNWLRIFTIDQDISGLSKQGEMKESLFNYSVTAIEAYYLQAELVSKHSFTDFITVVSKWLWARTEQNLVNIREKLIDNMCAQALSMIEELGKTLISKHGIESLGDFPDALVRARTGLTQAFENILGWFTRAQGANIKSFELDIPVQIASMALDVHVDFDDSSSLSWNGVFLNPIVDCLFILFENAVSKSSLPKSDINLSVSVNNDNDNLIIKVTNSCFEHSDIETKNRELDRYRTPKGFESIVDAAQVEGGSGFFKLWYLLEKDMDLTHEVKLGFVTNNSFSVDIIIPRSQCVKICANENFIN